MRWQSDFYHLKESTSRVYMTELWFNSALILGYLSLFKWILVWGTEKNERCKWKLTCIKKCKSVICRHLVTKIQKKCSHREGLHKSWCCLSINSNGGIIDVVEWLWRMNIVRQWEDGATPHMECSKYALEFTFIFLRCKHQHINHLDHFLFIIHAIIHVSNVLSHSIPDVSVKIFVLFLFIQ